MQLFRLISFGSLLFATCICCMDPAPIPVPSFTLEVYYKTSAGLDLLNPKTPGAFNTNDVKVFDLTTNANGAQTSSSIVNSWDKLCTGYVCQPDTSSGRYSIQYLVRPTNATTGAIIQINTSVADTLSYQLISASRPDVGYLVNRISYKGQVLWARATASAAAITFVK